MNTLKSLFTIAIISFSTILSAENESLLFSLQQLPDMTWGVFVKPVESIFPSDKTAAGSGQITIVAPVDFTYSTITNVSGTWVENARVDAPTEATDKAYISFGFVHDNPKIELFPNEETLLFTFTCNESFDGAISLFENGNDVFSTPNSRGTNPGNDIGILDFGTGNGMQTYRYAGNYEVNNNNPMVIFVSDDEDGEEEED